MIVRKHGQRIELATERLPHHLCEIGALHAWKVGYRGDRGDGGPWVAVGVFDSGIDSRDLYARRHLNRLLRTEDYAFIRAWDGNIDAYEPKRVTVGRSFVETTSHRGYVDELGHGTKMACIIGARPGFDGVAGLVPRVRLHNYRIVNRDGWMPPASLRRAVDAVLRLPAQRRPRVVLFALDQHVWARRKVRKILRKVLSDLDEGNVLTVVAASDTPTGGENLEVGPPSSTVTGGGDDDEDCLTHPAVIGRDLGGLVVVAAHNRGEVGQEDLTRTSNWGPETVHLAAPGRGIPSASPMAPVPVYGTSAAAALVAGAAALIAGKEGESAKTVRERLLNLCRSVDKLSGRVIGGRVLDLSGLKK